MALALLCSPAAHLLAVLRVYVNVGALTPPSLGQAPFTLMFAHLVPVAPRPRDLRRRAAGARS